MFVKLNFEEMGNTDWCEFEQFTLVEVFKNGGKVVQIYPYKVLEHMSSPDELVKYDDRGWKQYYSNGLMSNGFTPKNVIGTCRAGHYQDLVEVIKSILSKKEELI